MAGHIILPHKNLNRDQEKRFVLMCKPNERKRKIIQVQESQQEYKIRRIISFHLAKEMPLKDLEVNFNLLITNWGGDKAMGLFRIDRQRRWSKQFGQLLQNGKLKDLQRRQFIQGVTYVNKLWVVKDLVI
ncbi:unnamed protein product (macronuclear) [Paramecium tetraurelia]|uniref:Uncharacterized protein n=1 Tax=Paramecium tetraurelia TaxID=5888 RepID=A0CSZ3_PARTE|nr:uncharacterized protein GSPATT00038928001 [Paramecium tetraurelia]CAK73910.1 unnamed protein product [Paramecium tetraurelia]|eukprot:XP_001441307.1 hypothetical protein (macronuclear) [Paramecium tetraurelia strain d4-2]